METILAPIDFSAVTDDVLAESVKLARANRARLVVLHAVAIPLPGLGYETVTPETSALAQAAEAAADLKLTRIEQQLAGDYEFFETRRVVGRAAEQTAQVARQLGAAYIVIGSHGHGAMYELLVGSTTRLLLKLAPCPVVVVPAAAANVPARAMAGAMAEN
jgi:nucleotide-binding universal stress UspA family protein